MASNGNAAACTAHLKAKTKHDTNILRISRHREKVEEESWCGEAQIVRFHPARMLVRKQSQDEVGQDPLNFKLTFDSWTVKAETGTCRQSEMGVPSLDSQDS